MESCIVGAATNSAAGSDLWSPGRMISRAHALWRWRRRWRSPDIEHGSAISDLRSELLTATDRPSIEVLGKLLCMNQTSLIMKGNKD
ncbi:hypothetical protein V6N13_040887 [Hibiscus sabdariffa]|uniref:FHA domain-containing protein n=1 Tax=Hibiscus sabdariffa TaxID=183260 RepID=A0ABR2R9T5_9ROSI